MYKIEDNIIYLTRGDTLALDIGLTTQDGSPYTLETGDKVEFTLKSSVMLEEPVLVKEGTKITLTYEDTAKLAYGGYVYDVQVTFANGDRDTVIAPAEDENGKSIPNFVIMKEVNWT